jgi:hypothetical protein
MYKYHQKFSRLVQVDRRGEWHGYIDSIYKESFANEAEAIKWLEDRS